MNNSYIDILNLPFALSLIHDLKREALVNFYKLDPFRVDESFVSHSMINVL